MADSITATVARMLRPLLIWPAKWLAGPKLGATWHYEALVVACVLVLVASLTTPNPFLLGTDEHILRPFLIVWLSACAVFGSFLHAQVGTYMAEDMSSTEAPITECYYKLGEYWVYKELCWFLVFFISGAYPAIAGTIIFLIFPAWRKIYKEERLRVKPL